MIKHPSHQVHQDILDENSEILSGRDRKQKKALFQSLHESYADDPEFTTPVQKKSACFSPT